MKNKFHKLLMLLLLTTFIIGGCKAGSTKEKQKEQPVDAVHQEKETNTKEKETKRLTIAVGDELNTLVPLNMDHQNYSASKFVYETLVNYENGELKPGLAEKWEFSQDGKELTFYIRKGITFHDGEPLNAEAVKKNILFTHSNPNASFMLAYSNIQSIDLVDEYTLTIHYPSAYFATLNDFSMAEISVMVSPNVLEEGNFQSMKGVVGTGPYIYEEIVEGSHVRFIKNEAYWGEKGQYDEIIAKYIPESSSRLQALQTGEIDVIYGDFLLTYDDYQQAISLSGISGKVSEVGTVTRNIVFNASGSQLRDLKVREALAYAIDKQAIVDGLTYGYEDAADSLFIKGTPYINGTLDVAKNYDKEKAVALLEEAGYKMNESSSMVEKDGVKLSLKYVYDQGEALNEAIALTIKSQFAEIGVGVEVVAMEQMQWWQECVSGNYDIAMWNTPLARDTYNHFVTMYSMTASTASISQLENSETFKEYLGSIGTTYGEEKVKELFDYAVTFDHANVIDVPLSYSKDMIVYREDKLSDYQFDYIPRFFNPTGIIQ